MLDQAETLRQLITKEEENIKKEQENDYAR